LEKYELAHLTYKLLLHHYLGKCKKVILQQCSTAICIQQQQLGVGLLVEMI